MLFKEEFPRLIALYKESDWQACRLLTEHMFTNPELLKAINDLIAKSETTVGRGCQTGTCSTVQAAHDCKLWYDRIKQVINEFSVNGPIDHEVLPIFWLIYSSAYERWEDSFDYSAVSCRLHLARQVLFSLDEQYSKDSVDSLLIEFHELLCVFVNHSIMIENSMVTNDPDAMLSHAIKAAEFVGKAILTLGKIPKASGWISDFSIMFSAYLKSEHNYHLKLQELIKFIVLQQSDRGAFQSEFPGKREAFVEAIKSFENGKDYEHASEFRAHFLNVDSHFNHVHEPRITLEQVEGSIYYGFYINMQEFFSLCGSKFDYQSSKKNDFEKLKIFLKSNKNRFEFSLEILDVSNDPAPDILESSLGAEHFENILLTLGDFQMKRVDYLDGNHNEVLFCFSPKIILYTLGVGLICFEIKAKDLNISDFHTIKNSASPHSGLFEISAKGKNGTILKWQKLKDLAKDLLTTFQETLLSVMTSDYSVDKKISEKFKSSIECDIEHSWFTNFAFYSAHINGDRTPLKASELISHWEWPGIIAYQRADKASVDDWVNIDVSAMGLGNLAGIRAHKDDLYFIGENHSISYFPDDPRFIVLQYLETSKWTFLIRVLINYNLLASRHAFDILSTQINDFYYRRYYLDSELSSRKMASLYDEIQGNTAAVQRFESSALSALDHVNAIGVSQYADHALLLKSTFHSANVTASLEALKEKLLKIKSLQKSSSFLIEHIQNVRQKQKDDAEHIYQLAEEKRQKRADRRMNFLTAILLLISLLLPMEYIIKCITDFGFDEISLREVVLLSKGQYVIKIIGLLSIVALTVFLIIFLIKKFANRNKKQPNI